MMFTIMFMAVFIRGKGETVCVRVCVMQTVVSD